MIKISVSNVGHEELARMMLQKDNRASARAAARALFPSVAEDGQAKDSKLMRKLFVQAPGAETMAPTLNTMNKQSAAAADDKWPKKNGPAALQPVQRPQGDYEKDDEQTEAYNQKNKKKAKTAAIDAFFSKYAGMTDAQRRFPELLKVAKPTPTMKKRVPESASGPTGEPPVQSSLSGGAA